MPWPPNNVSYIGNTLGRGAPKAFGIKQQDRLSHIYLIGKTGTGKSTLITNLALQDIHAGRGLCLIDPHGDMVESLVKHIPDWRTKDVIYINTPDSSQPYGYNPFRYVSRDKRSLAASGILETFKKLWSDSWGVRMEHILRNAIFTLLEIPDSNLSDILRLLSDDDYRQACLDKLKNPSVRSFWVHEYNTWSPSFRANAIAPIQNKVGAYLTDERVKKLLVSPNRDISFRRAMDNNKIVFINLAKGQIGADAAHLIGGLMVTSLGLAAFSRQDTQEKYRKPFYIYLDEFQHFTTRFMADMLSELRKFRCGLLVSHQHLSQIDSDVREAILGNCGSLISFRLGAKDSPQLAKELAPIFASEDLHKLPNYQMAIRLMVDGSPTLTFSGKSFEALFPYYRNQPLVELSKLSIKRMSKS